MFRGALIAVVLTIPLSVNGSDPTEPVEAADRAAIKAVLDAHGAAWTRGDADAAAATLTDDADWVSGNGKVLVGRPAILQMHRDMLSGQRREHSTHTPVHPTFAS